MRRRFCMSREGKLFQREGTVYANAWWQKGMVCKSGIVTVWVGSNVENRRYIMRKGLEKWVGPGHTGFCFPG